MALRFFMLQAHYRSTLDLTDSALSAAEKGYKRLMESYANVLQLKSDQSDVDSALKTEILEGTEAVWAEMDDDFNAPKALARLFELASKVNSLKDGHLDMKDIDAGTLKKLQQVYQTFIEDIFGLKVEEAGGQDDQALDRVMQLIIDIRAQARENKDWGTSDLIRDTLNEAHIQLKDGKDGTTWARS